MVESSPFQVVMRRPIFAAPLSCRVDGPGVLSCFSLSLLLSRCASGCSPRALRTFPKQNRQEGAAGIDFPTGSAGNHWRVKRPHNYRPNA